MESNRKRTGSHSRDELKGWKLELPRGRRSCHVWLMQKVSEIVGLPGGIVLDIHGMCHAKG